MRHIKWVYLILSEPRLVPADLQCGCQLRTPRGLGGCRHLVTLLFECLSCTAIRISSPR